MSEPAKDGSFQSEAERILAEYRQRDIRLPTDYYSLMRPGVLFAYQQRVRQTIAGLRRHKIDVRSISIAEIGCGTGDNLCDFERWGAEQTQLTGCDLLPEFIATARNRLPLANLIQCDATALPWPDNSFDLVVQETVFTSVLSDEAQQKIAQEMSRILRPGGFVLWYDFFVNNPWNKNVRGVTEKRMRDLFPGFEFDLERVTLAPPLARRIAERSWPIASFLERSKLFCTHYLGFLRKCA